MKFFHLSDLHIGKRVNEVSMLEDQKVILEQILQWTDNEHPDAVLISGDVYDKSVPTAEAVMLFDEFLVQLTRRQQPVLIISGNHDSPERLSFGRRLMETSNVYISPVYNGSLTCITLQDSLGPIHFWLLPFIKPIHVRQYFPEDKIETYTDAVRTVLSHSPIDFSQRNVLLAHQFVTGAVTCDSEEITVGGLDNVDASVFSGFDYVALGHIHGQQNIATPVIRYCGTPLKYSFSEARQQKSITVVELNEKDSLHLRLLPLTPAHDMRELRGTFSQLTNAAFRENQALHDYLHITLTDEEDIPEAVGQLRQIYPNLMKLDYDNTRTKEDQEIDMPIDVECKSPLDLFDDLYEKQNNQRMSDVQRTYVQQLIEALEEDEA